MKPTHKRLAISGGVLIGAGPLLGSLGIVYGLNKSVAVLGTSGVNDPRALGSGLGTTLLAGVLGLGVGIVGIVLLVVGLTLARRSSDQSSPPPGAGKI